MAKSLGLMPNEREFLAYRLRNLLTLVEEKVSDSSQIRHRISGQDYPTGDEIASSLHHIEHRLAMLESSRCAYAEGGHANHVMRLVTGLEGHHREERKHITNWLFGTRQLTLVDPYFFSFTGPNKIFRTQAQYVKSIIDLLPKTLVSIEAFHLPSPNRTIFAAFQKHCRKKNILLRNWETTEVHDRVLIKSQFEAKALGTSFGGLSNKIAFVLDLPQEDLDVFRRELNRIKSEA